MTATLARQQRELVQALGLPRHAQAAELLESTDVLAPTPGWQRGLLAYRSNAIELARRALAAAYPVTARLVGDEDFGPLAVRLWREDPPARGDIAQWGAGLAALVESIEPLHAERPFLADLARVEWLLHRAAEAPDGTCEPTSFALMTERDPAVITLRLCPGVGLVASGHAVVTLIEAPATFPEQGMAETALVWREGLKSRVRACAPGEAGFIEALLQGRSLADALDAAPDFDFNAWLAPAVQGGLLLAVMPY